MSPISRLWIFFRHWFKDFESKYKHIIKFLHYFNTCKAVFPGNMTLIFLMFLICIIHCNLYIIQYNKLKIKWLTLNSDETSRWRFFAYAENKYSKISSLLNCWKFCNQFGLSGTIFLCLLKYFVKCRVSWIRPILLWQNF